MELENAAKDYAAGLAAGLAMVAVGHPFDTIKVKLQARSASLRYPSALHCAASIIRHEGVKGLYIGATSSFIGVAVESSLLFGVYSQMKVALQGGDSATVKLSAIMPSAAIGGAAISTILCPTELVKCRLQVQEARGSDKLRYNGPLDCAQKTLAHEGVKGLFRGWTATLFRECTGNTCFFTTYEIIRHVMHSRVWGGVHDDNASQNSGTDSLSRTLSEAAIGIVSGGFAGIAFWTAVLPFDVAKTRIQTAVNLNESTNLLHNLKQIYKELGMRGLYIGLGPTLVRAFPANAAAIVTWELTAKLLGFRRPQTAVAGAVIE